MPINSCDLLAINDIAAFVHVNEDQFEVKGNLPSWFFELNGGFKEDERYVELSKHFKYLDYFLIQANEFWNSTQNSKLVSDVWTEGGRPDREYYFQARAAKVNDEKYIFVELLDDIYNGNLTILDKARQKSLEFEKLVKAEKELQELLVFKENFVSIISHDLRSPVMAVSEFANLLLEDEELKDKLDETQKEFLSYISIGVLRLADYVKKLYHWSSLELGRFKLHTEEIPVELFLVEVFNTFQHKAKEKGIELKLDIKTNDVINIDQTLFLQVMNNLVGNAIKFTGENGKVLIEATKEDNLILLKVIDNGVGIKEENQHLVFSKHFEKNTRGTAGEKGSGLGLSIAKRIVDAHQFSIDFSSEEGVGTEFVIKI